MLISLLVSRLKCRAVIFRRNFIVETNRPLTVVPVRVLVILNTRVPSLPVDMVRTNSCPRLVIFGIHSID